MILENFKQTVLTRIAPSSIKKSGVGVFALKDIEEGIDPFGVELWNFYYVSNETYNTLSRSQQKLIKDFGHKIDGYWKVPDINNMNNCQYVNSSKTYQNLKLEKGKFITTRNIKEGEELFYFYEIYE